MNSIAHAPTILKSGLVLKEPTAAYATPSTPRPWRPPIAPTPRASPRNLPWLAAQHTAAAQHALTTQQEYAAVTAAQQAQQAADEQYSYRVAYYQLYGAWQAYAVADAAHGSRGQSEGEDSGCCVIG